MIQEENIISKAFHLYIGKANGTLIEMIDSSWIKRSQSPFNATEVRLINEAYTPHRHDTYTFAATCFGVQSFNYRRELRHALPGQVVVIHPDELHDGQAGTTEGFGYRAITVEPKIVREILPEVPLPHLTNGISADPVLVKAVYALCAELDKPLDDFEREENLEYLVRRLQALSETKPEKRSRPDLTATSLARSFIEDNLFAPVTIQDIATAAGKNRWELSREFKAAYGSSPYRYLIQRRLEAAIQLLAKGISPIDTAIACGFFDQSHFTRNFKSVYGITPAKWASLLR